MKYLRRFRPTPAEVERFCDVVIAVGLLVWFVLLLSGCGLTPGRQSPYLFHAHSWSAWEPSPFGQTRHCSSSRCVTRQTAIYVP